MNRAVAEYGGSVFDSMGGGTPIGRKFGCFVNFSCVIIKEV